MAAPQSLMSVSTDGRDPDSLPSCNYTRADRRFVYSMKLQKRQYAVLIVLALIVLNARSLSLEKE